MFKVGCALYYSMAELGLQSQFGHGIVQCAISFSLLMNISICKTIVLLLPLWCMLKFSYKMYSGLASADSKIRVNKQSILTRWSAAWDATQTRFFDYKHLLSAVILRNVRNHSANDFNVTFQKTSIHRTVTVRTPNISLKSSS